MAKNYDDDEVSLDCCRKAHALNATYADKDVEVEVSSGRLSEQSLDGAYASYHYPLDIPTYDGNPSITHPDVLYIEGGWNGYSYWMAFTPFPDDPRENPSVVASNDGVHWEVPVGGTNPVTPYSELEPGFTYFSDTDMVRLANGDLALYYRATNPSANQARIYRKTSSDGITWSAATMVIQVNQSALLASPAIVREANGTFSMWSINAATGNHLTRWERRTSPDGIAWSAPTTCTVPAIRGGGEPWHVDVIRDDTTGGYHALLMSNGDLNLYYRYSQDGLTWYGSETVIVPKVDGTVGYYRSAFMKSPTRPGAFDVYAPAVEGYGGDAVELMVLMRGIQLDAQPDLLTRGHDSVFILGSQFTAHVGTPAVGTMNSLPVMLLDSAATERVHAVVGLPPSWKSVYIEAIWANAGTGAGDVVIQHNNDLLKPGTGFGSVGYVGANITATAGAQNVVMVTDLTRPGSTPVTGGAAVIRILRRGADAADTLPNDIGLIGVRLRRAS